VPLVGTLPSQLCPFSDPDGVSKQNPFELNDFTTVPLLAIQGIASTRVHEFIRKFFFVSSVFFCLPSIAVTTQTFYICVFNNSQHRVHEFNEHIFPGPLHRFVADLESLARRCRVQVNPVLASDLNVTICARHCYGQQAPRHRSWLLKSNLLLIEQRREGHSFGYSYHKAQPWQHRMTAP
jgi:hypothetical protein